LIENETIRETRAAEAVEFIRQNCVWDMKLRALDALLNQVVKL